MRCVACECRRAQRTAAAVLLSQSSHVARGAPNVSVGRGEQWVGKGWHASPPSLCAPDEAEVALLSRRPLLRSYWKADVGAGQGKWGGERGGRRERNNIERQCIRTERYIAVKH